MFGSIIRVLVLYLVVLLALRVMGKRQLGEMQPFEFVITFMIAELAAIPMTERTVPLLNGAIPVLVLMLIHAVLVFMSKKSIHLRKVISGKPVVVITPSGIDFEALKRLSMTITELLEAIRAAGYMALSDVEWAIVETSGSVSVFAKGEKNPTTKEDMNIEPEPSHLQVTLILDGKFIKENLTLIGFDEKRVLEVAELVAEKKVAEKEVLIFTTDIEGNSFLQTKKDDAVSKKLDNKLFSKTSEVGQL
ncbi:MAG: DUF421 domain-containing protein [Firmicutes bacterium]|nr:DUF421 domain-containing protein [Bacillota bacterium]MCL2770837.1 DUF421 domain-containing protein [Bacillota bacterium]